jgi:hypothetical protein
MTIIDAMARAIHTIERHSLVLDWNEIDPEFRDFYRSLARAAWLAGCDAMGDGRAYGVVSQSTRAYRNEEEACMRSMSANIDMPTYVAARKAAAKTFRAALKGLVEDE